MASNPPEPFLEVEFEEATKFVRGKLANTAGSEDLLYLYARSDVINVDCFCS